MASLLTQHIFEPSLENMQHQKPDFFNALTVAIEGYKDNFYGQRTFTEKLNEIIKRFTNLTVSSAVTADVFANAYMQTAEFDQAHIFWSEFAQNYDEFTGRMKKPLNGSTGYIDTVNGRVGGIFGEYTNKLILTKGIIDLLNADELAAVILHEVGHVYTFYYFLGHVTISNLVISNAIRKILDVQDLNERIKIINQAADYLDIKDGAWIEDGDLAANVDFNNKTKIETILVNAHRRRHKSATGTDIYDVRSCEQLADQFAVRHGAGHALASGIAKAFGTASRGSFAKWTITIFGTIYLLALGIATLGILPALLLLALVFAPNEKAYDDSRYRVRLIKQNMIDRLKTMKLDPSERANLIKQVDAIERLEMSQGGKNSESVVPAIVRFLSSKRAAEMDSERLEKYLEDMVFSRLNVSHAKLQNLGV